MDKQNPEALNAALQNAFEGQEKELPEDYQPQTRDDDLEIEKKEDFKLEEDQKEEVEIEVETEYDEPIAPIHWSAEDRELFNNQTPEAKEWLLKVHKSMESDYTKKRMSDSDLIKAGQAVREAMAPIADKYKLQGMDEIAAVRQLAYVAERLDQDPATVIQNLAQQYNVDFNQGWDGEFSDDDDYYDPDTQKLIDKVNNVEQQLRTSEERAKQLELQRHQSMIDDFSNAVDSNGNKKHPFFEDVRLDMSQIFQAGAANDLGQAYEMAIAKNPDLRQKQMQLIQEQEKRANDKKRKDDVKRAKTAAVNIQSSTSANVERKSGSLRDLIQQAYNDTH